MTPLWKPLRKAEHDASLKRFIHEFNQASPKAISMSMWIEEKFIHDGTIDLWGIMVHYDWEKREDWYGERFPFVTLGQFERKFMVEKGIELTIQSNIEETCFVVAWHRDFGEPLNVSRETGYNFEEQGRMRTTEKFRIFWYSNITEFKKWLQSTCREKAKT